MLESNEVNDLCQSVYVSKHKLMDEIDASLDDVLLKYTDRQLKLKKLRSVVRYMESLVQLLRTIQGLDDLESFEGRLSFHKRGMSEDFSISENYETSDCAFVI